MRADLSDEQWEVLEQVLPCLAGADVPARHGPWQTVYGRVAQAARQLRQRSPGGLLAGDDHIFLAAAA